ncbi:MAG: hypothetical protein IAE91_06220 [Ignavibacteriaceae bacterium]|nr:hypothetical protein [Ignavibacteriaceae bacterium]
MKNLTLLALIILLFSPIFSQNFDASYSEVNEAFNMGYYHDSYRLGIELEGELSRANLINEPIYYNTCRIISNSAYFSESWFDVAYYGHIYLDYLAMKTGKASFDYIEFGAWIAVAHVNNFSYDDAELLFQEISHITKEFFADNNSIKGLLLTTQGYLSYVNNNDVIAASKFFDEANQLLLTSEGRNNDFYITIFANLYSYVLKDGDNANKLLAIIQQGDEAFERLKLQSSSSYYYYCSVAGSNLFALNETKDQSLIYFMKAKQGISEFFGRDNSIYANILLMMNYLYEIKGNYAECIALTLELLDTYSTIYSENNFLYVSQLNALARYYIKTEDLKTAELILDDLYILIEQNFGLSGTEYGEYLITKAGLLSITGKKSEAKELYLKAAQLFETVFGESHSLVIELKGKAAEIE